MKDSSQGRLRGAAPFEPPAHAPNAALLIDFDNVTMGIRSDLQNQLKRLLASDIFKGKVSVQRAYADWRRYPQYIVPLSEASIDLIFAPAFGSNKKNATDIRLAIDALELVFTRPEIGTFILLSGDSDFSSLVLKLKEYGKYVIGVGIRESSSDLLIQNCDEYFSYNELTGLAKESDIEHPRRDPWELVVEAVTHMRQNSDVMRSDRLKQVMQEIDPNFNEKDSGYSRFSKFVQEASQRGLVKLIKLDNGQFEVDLGSNANVPPSVESALAAAAAGPQEREAGDRSRRRRSRDRAEQAAVPKGVTLAQAFEALKQALLDLGAVGEESTDADQVRDWMVGRFGDADPIVQPSRFQRLLRQAHDANIIELAKSGEDTYMLRLAPQAGPPAEADLEAGERPGRHRPERPEPGQRPAEGRRGRRPPRERGGRGRGGRSGGEPGRGRARSDEPSPPPPPPPASGGGSGETPGLAGSAVPATGPPRRNVRFRVGSRRLIPPAPGPQEGDSGAEPAPAAPAPPPPPAATGTDDRRRSLRGRPGSSSFQRAHPGAAEGSGLPQPGSRAEVERPGFERENRVPASGLPAAAHPPAEPAAGETPAKSLFERMSKAFQKALGTGEKEDAK